MRPRAANGKISFILDNAVKKLLSTFCYGVALWALIAPPPVLADANGHAGHGHVLQGVGPARAPHIHKVDRSQLLRVEDISRRASDVPPSLTANKPSLRTFRLEVREVVAELADGVEFVFWTFDNTVPGPLMRARQGDTVELTIANHASSTHDHSIDLHAVTGPGGGGDLTQVAPGKEKTIRFTATHGGVFLYHCASPNVPSHITNGLYGLIVIDPEAGWPQVDREFYVMQGEFYTQGRVGEKGYQPFSPGKMMDEKPEYIVWNGRVRALSGERALKAGQGETVRIFVGNGGVAKTSNFHIIGEIFDTVFPEGAVNHAHRSVQTTAIPAGGAAAVELKLENSGNYILVDHALSRLDRGSYGFLQVSGDPVPRLLQAK